jgi:LuxR family transcriptional regulator, maltose regulon positive regulatory protein
LTDLVRTKLYIPQLHPSLVERRPLYTRLNRGLAGRLILVSAQAGSGKTTLLSAWLATVGKPVAWLSLDEDDSEPARFWTYVAAALQTSQPDLGHRFAAIINAPPLAAAPIESALTLLVNEFAAFADDLILVLDDYHVIASQPVHASLAFLIDHLPPRVHLVIATRADPPLPLARLRARGQLTELRTSDLRFTGDEAGAFLNDRMGLDLPLDQVAALADQTEGWAAGLQLAALSAGRQSARPLIAGLMQGDRWIVDYLADEVLRRQPLAVQTFLLQTCCLERLCASLCDAVTGQADGQAMLEQIERENLFLVPLDNRRLWYRYHHLFADLLRRRAQTDPAVRLPELHRRAAAWLEQQGLFDQAIGHALAAPDLELAARLIEASARAILFTRGEPQLILRWMAALPASHSEEPRLGLPQAWALTMTGQWDAAAHRLDVIESAAVTDEGAPNRAILGQAAAIRATAAAMRGDVNRLAELAQRALDWLPEEDALLRSWAAWQLAQSYRYAGNAAAAELAFSHTAQLARAADNSLIEWIALGHRANRLIEQSKLRQALEAHLAVQELARSDRSRPVPLVGESYISAGVVHLEWNELDAAAESISQGLALAEEGGLTWMQVNGQAALAFVQAARGDHAGAQRLLDRALALVQSHMPFALGQARAMQAKLWWICGNMPAAVRWAQSSGLKPGDSVSYRQEDEYLMLARVLIAQKEPEPAKQLLVRMLSAAEAGGRLNRVIEILILQSLVFSVSGDARRAVQALEQALALAEPENYVRSFLDAGEPVRRLLSKIERPSPYVETLRVAFGGETRDLDRSPASLVEALSEREMQVLRLIAAGQSNGEMADALVVSLNTIKTHVKRLYEKLGTRSRLETVERARELGLLQTPR